MKKYQIPLKLIELDNKSFHLLAVGSINEMELNLVIDTGASRTVFDRKLLESGFRESDQVTQEIQSAGITANQIDCKIAVADTFRIGNLVLRKYPVIMIDLEAINKLYHKVTGRNIHGLLGSDFLLQYKAKINYGKLVMKLKK